MAVAVAVAVQVGRIQKARRVVREGRSVARGAESPAGTERWWRPQGPAGEGKACGGRDVGGRLLASVCAASGRGAAGGTYVDDP